MLRSTLLSTLVVVALLAAEDAEPAKLPPAAQAVVERLAKAEAKIDADAAKQRSVERQKAIKDLDKAQATATKAGDLDAALAVKARIDELKKAEEVDGASLLGEERSANRDPAKIAVGSWQMTKTNGVGAQVEINADKSAKVSVGAIVYNGIWMVEKERIVIHWGGDPTKWENVAVEGPDRLAGDSFDAGRNGLILIRMKK
jgi:hypothetical protein